MSQNPYREGNLSCVQHPGCSKTTLPLYGYRSNRFRSMAPTPSIAARPCIPRISDATGKMAGLGKNTKRLYPAPRRPWRHSLPTGPGQACKCQVSHSSRGHPACSARQMYAGQRGKTTIHRLSTAPNTRSSPQLGPGTQGPSIMGYMKLLYYGVLTGDISKVGSERAAGCSVHTYVRNHVQYTTVSRHKKTMPLEGSPVRDRNGRMYMRALRATMEKPCSVDLAALPRVVACKNRTSCSGSTGRNQTIKTPVAVFVTTPASKRNKKKVPCFRTRLEYNTSEHRSFPLPNGPIQPKRRHF